LRVSALSPVWSSSLLLIMSDISVHGYRSYIGLHLPLFLACEMLKLFDITPSRSSLAVPGDTP
jgi:hypothetical protein